MRKIKEMQNCKNLKTILNGNLNSITMLQHYLMITLALLHGLKLAKVTVIKMYFFYSLAWTKMMMIRYQKKIGTMLYRKQELK